MDSNLLEQVKSELKARKGQWKMIAADVPGVSYSWISQVGRGNYKSAPSYERLLAISSYLTKSNKG